jgi:lipopolysaccharide transport system ATP-binding protein
MQAMIVAEHLSKEYRLGVINHGMLYKDVQSWLAWKMGKRDPHATIGSESHEERSDRFWALRDVGFEIEQGDRVGIIGRNGAGKSTLLKILSRITAPTEGTVKLRGKVMSLLEVGTGFHPELTGRENIYLNGAILGMKKAQIAKKMEAIVDFSEIEQFIDTPVKRYSSGMYVRLAFAVAANLDSEILLADEVLAVGDAAFQRKCLGKMDEVSREEGRTILFVSHNMGSVRQLCEKGIVLEHGLVAVRGSVDDAINAYMGKAAGSDCVWEDGQAAQKSDTIRIRRIRLLDINGETIARAVSNDEQVFLALDFEILKKANDLTIGFRLYNSSLECAYRSLTTDRATGSPREFSLGPHTLSCPVPMEFLRTDSYSLTLDVSLYGQKWIINPEKDREFSIGINVINEEFGSKHSPVGAVSPSIVWELS